MGCAGSIWAQEAHAPLDYTDVLANGLALHVAVVGEGELVVVVPGGPGLEHTYLLPHFMRLASSHRLLLFDPRAVGSSAGDVSADALNLTNQVADIDALRAAQGAERMHLMGHSFGAIVAVLYALEHPGRLASLTLISPSEPGQRFAQLTAERARAARTTQDEAERNQLLDAVRLQPGDLSATAALLAASFRSTFFDRRAMAKLNLDFQPSTFANMGAYGAAVFAKITEGGGLDLWDRLGEVDAPTLLLHGAHDSIPLEMVRALGDAIPDARVVVLERSGHFPFIEEPAVVFDTLGDFIREAAEKLPSPSLSPAQLQSVAVPLAGSWRAERYVLADGTEHPLVGRIFFTDRDWQVLFFVLDADGNAARASGEGGTYELDGNQLSFHHEHHFSQGEPLPGLPLALLRKSVTTPDEAATTPEVARVELDGDRLTIHFPSGNRIDFSRSSRSS